jgi:hypothetical protein
VTAACSVAGARTGKYVTPLVRRIPNAAISNWSETLRYKSPCCTLGDAQTWLGEADQVYTDTVAAMVLDGVIR